nr:aminopeptidase M1-like isoform X2 [Tanacetum cinerariifolium]
MYQGSCDGLAAAGSGAGMEPVSGESHLNKMLREEVFMALDNFDHKETHEELKKRFQRYVKDKDTALFLVNIRKFIQILYRVDADDFYENYGESWFIVINNRFLEGIDTESEPFKGKSRTPESPHIVAPPTCHIEESEGSGTFGSRSTSSDSTAPLSPYHPLTHTTPTLLPILCRTTCIAVCVLPVMSYGLSAGIAEVATMSDSAFCKSEEDEEVEESSDSDSESEGAEDEGPTVEDEDPAVGDEGLAAGVEGLGVDDESHGLDDEGRGVEIDGLGLEEEEEAVPGGQQQAAPVTDPKDGMVYIDIPVYPPLAPPIQTPPSPEWTSGSLPILPSPSVVPSPVSLPMTPLTVPSPIPLPMATSTATILIDEDQFIEIGTQLKLYRSILQDHTQRLDVMPPTLFAEIDRDVRELYTRSGAVSDEIFSQRNRFRSLKHEQERTAMTFGALWRPVFALERELPELRGHVTALEQERDRRERLVQLALGSLLEIFMETMMYRAGIICIKHHHNVVRDTLVDICYWSRISAGELEMNAVTLLKRIQKFSMTQDIGTRDAVHIFNRIGFAVAKGVGA